MSQMMYTEAAEAAASNDATAAVMCGMGLLFLLRKFRARNCEGPYALAGENRVTYCSLLKKGLLPNGRAAKALTEKELSPDQAIFARNPERWKEFYAQQQANMRQGFNDCVEIVESDTYTADEITFVRNNTIDEIMAFYQKGPRNSGEDFEGPGRWMPDDGMEAFDRYTELRTIVEYADEVLEYEVRGFTRPQAIETCVAMRDTTLRHEATRLLYEELDIPPTMPEV